MDEKWVIGEPSRFYGRESVAVNDEQGYPVADVYIIDEAWTDDEVDRIPGPQTMARVRVIAAAHDLLAVIEGGPVNAQNALESIAIILESHGHHTKASWCRGKAAAERIVIARAKGER